MFNSSLINGRTGRYSYKINDNSVRFARNSVDNLKQETKLRECASVADVRLSVADKREFLTTTGELHKAVVLMDKKLPSIPFNYIQQYMPNVKRSVDTMALMGAAYEEMGKRASIGLSEANKKVSMVEAAIFGKNSNVKMSADVLDFNGDGEIDLAEYSALILAKDALSDGHFASDERNIDGYITSVGQKRALAFMLEDYRYGARNVLQGLYGKYGLEVSQKFFLSNKNNLVE